MALHEAKEGVPSYERTPSLLHVVTSRKASMQ